MLVNGNEPRFIETNISKIMKNGSNFNYFAKYRGVNLFSENPEILSMYRGIPETDYDKQLIVDFIEFMESRVISKQALHDELSAHAYRFRHPSEFIEKFFIRYEKDGNAGKSFFAACLASMYNTEACNFANVAVTPKQLESDQFDAWCYQLLMLNVEEAEDKN
jgi:hypothetical protein